jgi:predicted nucleic acid-binding protein
VTCFLDSNVILYAFAQDSRSRAAQLLMADDFEISAQVLNEFANVSRKKLKRHWTEIETALVDIQKAATMIHPIGVETTRAGLFLARRYQLAIYDSILVAAALIARCTDLWSEDMQHGLVIEGRLTIRNPFI